MAPKTAEQLSGLPMGPSAGSQVGNYQILGKIGSGGMASVYLARAHSVGGFEREVALKLVHEHLADDAEHRSYLLREARLSARIRHRNVVQVFDVGEADAGLYLVMEYVEGGTLDGLVAKASTRGETIPPSIALRIITDALSGLHAAHEAEDDAGKPLGLVHRDFSPHNILVGVDGSVKLADFGIAKMTRSLNQTRSGTLKGKASYMAPEQVRSQHLDRRCDVWAAGVVTWELLAGQRLQPRLEDEMATLMRILTVRPKLLRAVNPSVPEPLEQAVAGALEQRLEKRWPSAAEFRDQLLKAAKASGIELSDPLSVANYVQFELGEVLTQRRAKITAARKPDEGLLALDHAPEAGQTKTGFTSKVSGRSPAKDRTLVFFGVAATLVTLGVLAGRYSAPGTRTEAESSVAAQPAPVASAGRPPAEKPRTLSAEISAKASTKEPNRHGATAETTAAPSASNSAPVIPRTAARPRKAQPKPSPAVTAPVATAPPPRTDVLAPNPYRAGAPPQ